jgi:hypothetical protein
MSGVPALLICASHSPRFLTQRPPEHDERTRTFARLRGLLERFDPELIVMFGPDHEVREPNALDVRVWLGGDLVHFGTAIRGGEYGLRGLDVQKRDGPCEIEITGLGRLCNPVVRS